jgi:hypothetical protein
MLSFKNFTVVSLYTCPWRESVVALSFMTYAAFVMNFNVSDYTHILLIFRWHKAATAPLESFLFRTVRWDRTGGHGATSIPGAWHKSPTKQRFEIWTSLSWGRFACHSYRRVAVAGATVWVRRFIFTFRRSSYRSVQRHCCTVCKLCIILISHRQFMLTPSLARG